MICTKCLDRQRSEKDEMIKNLHPLPLRLVRFMRPSSHVVLNYLRGRHMIHQLGNEHSKPEMLTVFIRLRLPAESRQAGLNL